MLPQRRKPRKTGSQKKKGGDQNPHSRLTRSRGKEKPRRYTTAVRTLEDEMRLNKFISEAGVASRRKADELISSGVVRVNGKLVTELGTKVNPHRDEVSVRGTPVYIQAQLFYVLLNKPKDCITTTSDDKGRRTVMDLIPQEHHVYPVGRLDRNTTGALLLTNDGDLANVLMHPRFHVSKTYVIDLGEKISSQDIEKLRKGVKLEDGVTAPASADVLDPPVGMVVGMVLREGRNRQVRRMFEALDYTVRRLDRVDYCGLSLKGLKRGAWRYLDESEVGYLKNLAAKHKL
jgi:23S rRNA pseudouridine2605 synthase